MTADMQSSTPWQTDIASSRNTTSYDDRLLVTLYLQTQSD